MKKLLLLVVSFNLSAQTLSSNLCKKCDISFYRNEYGYGWEFTKCSSVKKKWFLVRNNDNGFLYAKEQVDESGFVHNNDLEKNKTGYSSIIIETTQVESSKLEKSLKDCSSEKGVKKDCSFKEKLSGCVLNESKIPNKKN